MLFPLLVAGHLIGDWVVQTDWQAANKATSWKANQQHMAGYHLALAICAAGVLPAGRLALVLAVSGGPDSTALMLLAARWRDALNHPPRLIAVTVDHGLRQESKAEAAAVARLARKLKVVHRTLRWRGKKPSSGLQQAARTILRPLQ